MFGSEALDVTIGLVLIFLLVSLLLTALTEIIESILKSRAADLERAIGLMLQDPDVVAGASQQDGPAGRNPAVEAFYKHPLVFALFRADEYNPSKKSWFFGRETGGDLPSYIPRDLFSAVALDLESAGTAGNGMAQVIEAYRRLYGDNSATLKASLESWYDGVMDRAAGWYKRRTQKLLFWLGLALAVALNINPIIIGQHLAATPAAREQMIEVAARTVAAGQPSREEQIRELEEAVRGVGLPIGWSRFSRSHMISQEGGPGDVVLAVLIALSGWGITAVAATLGAPFWFDLLNKLMVIRATVKPKEKSPDESSEDRSPAERKPEVAFVASGRGSGGRVSGGAAGALAPGSGTDHSLDDADGCLDGYLVPDEDVTDDVELPPATGGIEGRE